MMTRFLRLGLVLAIMGFAAPALAQMVPPLEKHRYWGVFVNGQGTSKVCFIMSLPYESTANREGVRRGPIYFYVTSRPGEGVSREPSIAMGYPLATDQANIVIDGAKRFDLKTEGETAWVANPAQEAAIIEAMKAGTKLVITGTSTKGTVTSDTYSLSGVTAAMNSLSAQCP